VERLTLLLGDIAHLLSTVPRRVSWESRRAGRAVVQHIGWAGATLVAGLVMAGAAGWVRQDQAERLMQGQQQVLIQRAQLVARPADRPAERDGRARLAEFDAYLPRHDEIPATLAALFNLAQREGLSIARGEYKAEADGPGRFLRYRMTLPVQGDAAAVRRFMLAALQAHKTLALESVQFKRERSGAAEVDARIQWVLLLRLPGGEAEAGPVATAGAAGKLE